MVMNGFNGHSLVLERGELVRGERRLRHCARKKPL
jgi:hypothetical protein